MRAVALTTIKGGISRLRDKGAARPDALHDLVNGFVTAARTVKKRHGTFRMTELPWGTKGLTAFDGALHVFATQVIDVPEGYVLHVLAHPNYSPDAVNPEDFELKQIHFAEPFMGFLYVVAEFANGDVFHFWLQSGGAWQANRVYKLGDIIEPTTPNGLAYQATRLSAPRPVWAANAPRTVGDEIEPTEYNDFFYTVIETQGDSPASGVVEPDWPEEDGARVYEDTEGGTGDASVAVSTNEGAQKPAGNVSDRYEL